MSNAAVWAAPGTLVRAPISLATEASSPGASGDRVMKPDGLVGNAATVVVATTSPDCNARPPGNYPATHATVVAAGATVLQHSSTIMPNRPEMYVVTGYSFLK